MVRRHNHRFNMRNWTRSLLAKTFAAPLGSDQSRGQAQHVLGYADRFDHRAREHLTGRGAKSTQALHARGISFQIARTWPGSRAFERELKNRKDAPACADLPRAAADRAAGPRPGG